MVIPVNRFLEGLAKNPGKHVCVCLAGKREEVPAELLGGVAALCSDLEIVNAFNRIVVESAGKEVLAYRISLAGYANSGEGGLVALRDLISLIRCRNPRALILLDLTGKQSGEEVHWTVRQTITIANSLGVEAVVINPCEGRDALCKYLRRVAAMGMQGFVSCQGCCRRQRKASCFNFSQDDPSVDVGQWLDFAIGHDVRHRKNVGMVLSRVNLERLRHLDQLMPDESVALLAPWRLFPKSQDGFPMVLPEKRFRLLVELVPEELVLDGALIARIRQSLDRRRRAFASSWD